MKRRAVVLLSGGLDSTTLVYQLLYEDFDIIALNVDYGQRHVREIESAQEIAAAAQVPLVQVQLARALTPIFAGCQSSQVGLQDVPEGHYAAETMRITLVPNRNMLLLSLAGALAESREASLIAYAAHAGDHSVYADCRPSFYKSCDETIQQATEGRVRLYAPFGKITKADIVKRGSLLHVPLGLTWSCYKGGTQHCGRCSTCVERAEAFSLAGVPDPTSYEDSTYWKTVVHANP